MDIEKLRSQTTKALASKEALEDEEFNDSPLRRHYDRLIQEAASNGESKISSNFYYTKEDVLGKKYGGPSIGAAIRHYTHEGFNVHQEHWLSRNGYGNTNLVISWM